MAVAIPAGWNPIPPAVAPLTPDETLHLRTIVMNQYKNMTNDQRIHMNGNYNTVVTGYPNMRIIGEPSGDGGLTKNIRIRRQIAANRFSPSVLLFNTSEIVYPELPVEEAMGGKKSRRRKSRKSRRRI
jgi:hypothetical protein